jgi:hypothetical protein
MLMLTLALCACSSDATSGGGASASPTVSPASATPAPRPAGFTTQLRCSGQASSAHALALFHDYGKQSPLAILDVSDPQKPIVICTLAPAEGGRFLSATKVAFSAGDRLGLADLSTGTVVQTAQLRAVTFGGAFSRDGSRFAYQLWDDTGGLTLHLWSGGHDSTLYTQDPLGGHGGPGWASGPFSQLQFSPDGRELLDYILFRPMSGPANLQVFKLDGSPTVLYKGTAPAVWAPTGSLLYSSFWPVRPPTTEVDSIDATGQRRIVASGLNGYYWPSMTPDGRSIVYDTVDAAGLPHLWALDLNTGASAQLSGATTAQTRFVGPTVVWENEGGPCECGPGGNSMPDGVMLAHDLSNGRDVTVDSSFYRALVASETAPAYLYADFVVDTWF